MLAVQNAVPYSQLGVASSAASLFRSIGGSLGTAILGAIFANRLADELATSLPAGSPAAVERLLAARQRSLVTLVADRESEAPELDAMIARLSGELSQGKEPAAG